MESEMNKLIGREKLLTADTFIFDAAAREVIDRYKEIFRLRSLTSDEGVQGLIQGAFSILL